MKLSVQIMLLKNTTDLYFKNCLVRNNNMVDSWSFEEAVITSAT
jgi:hypothetical protein